MSKRALTIGVAIVAAVAVLAVAARSTGSEPYRVRAIFDNASAVVVGEDVKVAGVVVGRIDSLDVTPDKKAAIVLRIDDRRFTPFRADAHCTIRPQSLIGEKFVACDPGSSRAPELRRIEHGPGKGQYLLPVRNTSTPVDVDLVNDVMRLPFRQRLAIVVDELGTGLAGRGRELNEVIHRANPALRETDRVLATLARQNRILARLAEESDRVLAPLAREREQVADFIVQANRTGQASAERRADIRRSIARLPGFLRQLRPLMADLEGFVDQATPVARDLNRSGTEISRVLELLGPFSRASVPAVTSLGRATERGRPALVSSLDIVRQLGDFGRELEPLARDLAAVTASLDRTGAIDYVLQTLFYGTTSTNGFDALGHYLRARLLVNQCTDYTATQFSSCIATFGPKSASASASANAAGEARAARAGSGSGAGAQTSNVPATGSVLGGLLGDQVRAERERALRRLRANARQGSPALRDAQPLLDYLLGGDGR